MIINHKVTWGYDLYKKQFCNLIHSFSACSAKKEKHIGDVVNVKPFILNVFSPVDPELCNIWSLVGD